MFRVFLKVLNLLFTIEHLPALDAEDFTVRFRFYDFELLNELFPLGRKYF